MQRFHVCISPSSSHQVDDRSHTYFTDRHPTQTLIVWLYLVGSLYETDNGSGQFSQKPFPKWFEVKGEHFVLIINKSRPLPNK